MKVTKQSTADVAAALSELRNYSCIESGRVLVIADADDLAARARQDGYEVDCLSPNQLRSNSELPAAYDLCILAHSLEQMGNPLETLQSIRAPLGDRGSLMVISSTANATAARDIRGSWWKNNEASRFFFSIDTLQNLLVKAGFTDAKILTRSTRVSTIRETTFLVRPNSPRAVPLLSVIVPAYNEKNTFPVMMDRLLQKTINGLDVEVIVIESNSTDGTREEVQRYTSNPRVRVIFEDRPRGKGHAVRAGLDIAKGDLLLIQDADLEYDVNDYDGLVAPLLNFEANFVLGSRHNSTKTSWKIRSFTDSAALAAYFNLGHVLFLALFNYVYKQNLTDPFTMYKVFRRECIWGLLFECDRFDFDNEIVIKLIRKGYTPLELPVNYVSRSLAEGKKITLVGDALRWLRALVKFRKAPLYSSAN